MTGLLNLYELEKRRFVGLWLRNIARKLLTHTHAYGAVVSGHSLHHINPVHWTTATISWKLHWYIRILHSDRSILDFTSGAIIVARSSLCVAALSYARMRANNARALTSTNAHSIARNPFIYTNKCCLSVLLLVIGIVSIELPLIHS